MNKFNKGGIVLILGLAFGLNSLIHVHAATSPTLVGSASYSVLGASTVTNTGLTTTIGDVGVSAGTAITGFPPGIAAGSNILHLHSNDASAIAAQADNLTAFGALNAGTNADANCLKASDGLAGTDISGTDLVGLSLAPGLYCSAGSFLLTNGVGTDLTLTGAGPWVFKTVSTVIVSNSASVAVPAPADACNVWWRVGSSATIGTSATFKGNILALTSVGLDTGAALVGRAFAQTGAVTLDTNTITGCSTPLVAPNLTLNKIVSGPAAESTWTLTAAGPLTLSGIGATGSTDVAGDLVAGTYVLSESSGPSYYNASAWSCAGTTLTGNSITLTYGDVATCSITNTYAPPTSSGGGGTYYVCKDTKALNYQLFGASNPALCRYATATTSPVVATIPIFIPKLPNTGIDDSAGITKAEAISAFHRSIGIGARGADVTALQSILEQKGFLTIPSGVAKGYFGALTRASVVKYQASNGLPSVGVFGPLTRAKLISELSE